MQHSIINFLEQVWSNGCLVMSIIIDDLFRVLQEVGPLLKWRMLTVKFKWTVSPHHFEFNSFLHFWLLRWLRHAYCLSSYLSSKTGWLPSWCAVGFLLWLSQAKWTERQGCRLCLYYRILNDNGVWNISWLNNLLVELFVGIFVHCDCICQLWQ